MVRLARAFKSSGATGTLLPTVFPKFEERGIKMRAGQVTMLASAPNAGKSLLALVMAVKMNVPTLYFSADTDRHDTMVRAAAHLTGTTMDEVDLGMENAPAFYEEVLDRLDNISFCFDPSPTLEDIEAEARAYEEVEGVLPTLIVIDNLINVQMGDVDEFRGLRLIMAGLHHMARATGSCVLVLHHVTGEYDDGKVPPRRALHGKVSHLPEVILTAAQNSGCFIGVAAVKNRNGPSDPLAEQPLWLPVDFAKVQVKDG